jgi:hypothetical protein
MRRYGTTSAFREKLVLVPDKLVLADTVLVVKYLSSCQTMKTKRALSRGFAQGKDNQFDAEHVPSVDLHAEMFRNKLTVLLVIKGIIHMLWPVGALAVEFCGWPSVTDPTQSNHRRRDIPGRREKQTKLPRRSSKRRRRHNDRGRYGGAALRTGQKHLCWPALFSSERDTGK